MKNKLSWIADCKKQEFETIIREYGYFIHRFTQFIALLIGHTGDEKVRSLLLPNLVDEVGNDTDDPSHVFLYQRFAKDCGVTLQWEGISSTSKAVEEWFYQTFNSEDTLRALCALGPGTEEISHWFLGPMEEATIKHFPTANLAYFDVHRAAVEENHINDIRSGISVLKNRDSDQSIFEEKVQRFSHEAIQQHLLFWENLHQGFLK